MKQRGLGFTLRQLENGFGIDYANTLKKRFLFLSGFTSLDKDNKSNKHYLTGFTIVELIMVIVILAVIAALAIPRFDSYYTIILEGAARRLVSDIRYTQRLAIAKHDDYGIEFNTGSDSYRVYRVSDNSTAVEPLSRGNFIMNYTTDSEFKSIDLASANFGGTSNLRFTSLGTPQDANGNNLASAGTATISYKGSSKTVSVTINTGKVNLQ